MTIWQNGVGLRVMVSEGLTGPLCWEAGGLFHLSSSVRIESVPEPDE